MSANFVVDPARLARNVLRDGETPWPANAGSWSNLQDGAESAIWAKRGSPPPGLARWRPCRKLDAGGVGTILTETAAIAPRVWADAADTALHARGRRQGSQRRRETGRGAAQAGRRGRSVACAAADRRRKQPSFLAARPGRNASAAGDRTAEAQVRSGRSRPHKPQVAYRETIRKGTTHHARFKRVNPAGHGQFADIKVEISPLPRGAGITFTDSIVGGVVPRNFIPAVEAGMRDNTARGPLGFPVVDLNVRLFDGQYHSVDSSDQAFRTAARQAMTEGLPQCDPVLLEPIYEVTRLCAGRIHLEGPALGMTQRRAQILGFDAREGWDGWEEIRVNMPESEMQDLILDIRSISQGTGTYSAAFNHYQELDGRDADKVIEHRKGQHGRRALAASRRRENRLRVPSWRPRMSRRSIYLRR